MHACVPRSRLLTIGSVILTASSMFSCTQTGGGDGEPYPGPASLGDPGYLVDEVSLRHGTYGEVLSFESCPISSPVPANYPAGTAWLDVFLVRQTVTENFGPGPDVELLDALVTGRDGIPTFALVDDIGTRGLIFSVTLPSEFHGNAPSVELSCGHAADMLKVESTALFDGVETFTHDEARQTLRTASHGADIVTTTLDSFLFPPNEPSCAPPDCE